MPTRPPSHKPAHSRSEQQRKADADRNRPGRRQRGYTRAWEKIRLAALRREPLCRACKAEGRVTAATEVDHIDGNARNNAADNLRPLCKPCHSRRTARDQGFGRRTAPEG